MSGVWLWRILVSDPCAVHARGWHSLHMLHVKLLLRQLVAMLLLLIMPLLFHVLLKLVLLLLLPSLVVVLLLLVVVLMLMLMFMMMLIVLLYRLGVTLRVILSTIKQRQPHSILGRTSRRLLRLLSNTVLYGSG